MKINGITALDYKSQGDLLQLTGLAASSLEEITSMDTTLVKVQTDDGDLVEAFAGYAMRSATYDLASGTYTAVLAQGMEAASAALTCGRRWPRRCAWGNPTPVCAKSWRRLRQAPAACCRRC